MLKNRTLSTNVTLVNEYEVNRRNINYNPSPLYYDDDDDYSVKNYSKLKLLNRPCQNGKTSFMINNILNNFEKFPNKLCIVFSQNTIGNTIQLGSRITSNLENKKVVYFNSSPKEKNHVNNLLELRGLTVDEDDCPSVILCCSNFKRFDDIKKFIEFVDKHPIHHISNIELYFDEIHMYKNQIIPLLEMESPIISQITGMTATPQRILDFYSKKNIKDINIVPENYYDKEVYYGCEDAIWISPPVTDEIMNDKFKVKYAEMVLHKYKSNFKEGSLTIVPVDIRCVAHRLMRDIIFDWDRESVVILINGKEKTITYYDLTRKISEDIYNQDNSVLEISKAICKFILEKNIEKRKIFLTGHNCIKIGQTFLDFMLDFPPPTQIIHPLVFKNGDETYQAVGRGLGNFKKQAGTRRGIIYTSKDIEQLCKLREKAVISVFTNNDDNEYVVGSKYTEICKNKLGKDEKNYTRKSHEVKVFETYEKLKKYLNDEKKKGEEDKFNYNPRCREKDRDTDGFIRMAAGSGKGKSSIFSLEQIKNTDRGLSISGKKARYFVCYEDIKDKSTEKHVLCYKKR